MEKKNKDIERWNRIETHTNRPTHMYLSLTKNKGNSSHEGGFSTNSPGLIRNPYTQKNVPGHRTYTFYKNNSK